MVQVEDYVYAVPFVETDTEIFLKTIIPSRKRASMIPPRDNATIRDLTP